MKALNGTVSDNSLNIVDAEDTKVINIGKKLIASAISNKGIGASGDDSFADLAKQIEKISYKANKSIYQTSVNANNTIVLQNVITTYEGE